jgi:hypothetical protein
MANQIAAHTNLRVGIQRGAALGNARLMRGFWRHCNKKPIAPEARENYYPGPGTSSAAEWAAHVRAAFPLPFANSFQFESPGRIWRRGLCQPMCQSEDKKQLNCMPQRSRIGADRAIPDAVGAFHMTICRELQARGKGLACHFLQIVPTCL